LDASPAAWRRLPEAEYSLPPGVRHANTARISLTELDALKLHYDRAPSKTPESLGERCP